MKKIISILFVVIFSLLTLNLSAFASSEISPIAIIKVEPGTEGTTGTRFTFDASDSINSYGKKGNMEYRWNLRDEDGYTEWSRSSKISTQYDSPDDRNVWLQVRDESGATDRTKIKIQVKETNVPDTILRAYPKDGTAEDLILIRATPISRIGTPKEEMEVRYDFENDGVWDTKFSNTFSVYHVFYDTGRYEIAVEVRDIDGSTYKKIGIEEENNDDQDYVRIIPRERPEASFSVDPSYGDLDFEFEVDANLSFDHQDYHNLDFRWDFEDDGLWDTYYSSQNDTMKIKYDYEGIKTIRLQVIDSDGNTDETTRRITVVRSENSPPRADFDIKVKYDRKSFKTNAGTLSAIFEFNASKSEDFEDKKRELLFRWDFENDGVWDTPFVNSTSAEHRYSNIGEYRVRLQVEDTNGTQDSTYKNVRVVGNDAPVPVFSISPETGTPATQFTFDAKESFDAQTPSNLLRIRWDFDGDGAFDTDFSNTKTKKYEYDSYGTFYPLVQVVDLDGLISELEQELVIQKSTAPVASLTVNETEGVFQTKFEFDASSSYDHESEQKDLKFRWDFNRLGDNDLVYDTNFGRNSTYKKKFEELGERTVRVEVLDPDGNIDSAELQIEILPESKDVDFLYKRRIMRGYPDGTFRLKNNVNRAEMVYMLTEAANIKTSGYVRENPFPDVDRKEWYAKALGKSRELGIINGYPDGNFHGDWNVNRAEAILMTLKSFDVKIYCTSTPSDVSCGKWFSPAVSTAYRDGVLDGLISNGKLNPAKKMTRGEVARLIRLAIEKYEE